MVLSRETRHLFYYDISIRKFLKFDDVVLAGLPRFIIAPTHFDGSKASHIINSDSRKNFGVRP